MKIPHSETIMNSIPLSKGGKDDETAIVINDFFYGHWRIFNRGGMGCAAGDSLVQDTGIDDWVSYNVTQIEFFPTTTTGFDNTPCEQAIEELQKESPNQGQLKQYIDDCMGYEGGGGQSEPADQNAAFNHAIHNCWYKAKHGDWITTLIFH